MGRGKGMESGLLAYNAALGLLTPLLPPLALAAGLARGCGGRTAEVIGDLAARLFSLPRAADQEPGPRVWLQAVSLGEVGVAQAVAAELAKALPAARIFVSASTGAGLKRARQVFHGKARVFPFPLDLPANVALAAARLRPHVFASLETEIWPNLVWRLWKNRVPQILLNGRISPRSFPRYQKARWLMAPTLARFAAFSMIGDEDARRIVDLGAPARRVTVGGNAKYAGIMEKTVPDPDLAARLNLEGAPLLVAGSLRGGEEAPVLAAFAQVAAQHPEAVLALAPRHVEKSRLWLKAAGEAGLTAQAFSALTPQTPRAGDTRVVVIDVMGRLMAAYGLARAAFVGASLVPLGGQNPVEPAAWGVPMAFGPSMEDFAQAAQALVGAAGALEVRDAEQLGGFWLKMLGDEAAALAMGRAARETARSQSGAAAGAAGLIVKVLQAAYPGQDWALGRNS